MKARDQETISFELGRINPDQGCLSKRSGAWPRFALNQSELNAVRSAILRDPAELNVDQRIDVALTAYRCTACHDRDGLGGITSETNPHFKTTNLNLGDQGRIPPTLTGIGAKLNAKWMRDVLVNRKTIRPYMKTRMPEFGKENVEFLVELFQTADPSPDVRFASFENQEETRKHGLTLAGNQGLNCVACHTYKFKRSDTMPAVDLTEMTARLKKEWYYQYMRAPQKI